MLMYLIVFGALVSAAVGLLLAGLFGRAELRAVEEARLYSATKPPTLEEVELSLPFFERAVKPSVSRLLSFLSRFAPQRNIQELQHKLEVAGRPNGWTPMDFVGLRVLCGIVVTALALALLSFSRLALPSRLLFTALFGVLGFYLPVVWLGRRMSARKHALLRALPDGLDMLNVCVGAGLGLDAGMGRVGERWQNALADEFNRIVAEIRLGKVRRQALLDFSARTELNEVESFVTAIVQADQLGVSIAKVLRTQAEQMRIARRQRAEELARQASIKMLFPLVFLIFPSLLAVLLGPAVPQILRTFADLGQ